MSDIQRIDFHGDQISTCRDEQTGKVYCIPREISETLGLAWNSQWKKLQSSFYQRHIIRYDIITESSGERETLLLDIDMLPSWLMGISAERVKPEIRDKLLAYQEECAKALRDYWTTGLALNPRLAEVPALTNAQLALITQIASQAAAVLLQQGVPAIVTPLLAPLHTQQNELQQRIAAVEQDQSARQDELTALKVECAVLKEQNTHFREALAKVTPPDGWRPTLEWLHDLHGTEREQCHVLLRYHNQQVRKQELGYFEYLAVIRMQEEKLIEHSADATYLHQYGSRLYMPRHVFQHVLARYLEERKKRQIQIVR